MDNGLSSQWWVTVFACPAFVLHRPTATVGPSKVAYVLSRVIAAARDAEIPEHRYRSVQWTGRTGLKSFTQYYRSRRRSRLGRLFPSAGRRPAPSSDVDRMKQASQNDRQPSRLAKEIPGPGFLLARRLIADDQNQSSKQRVSSEPSRTRYHNFAVIPWGLLRPEMLIIRGPENNALLQTGSVRTDLIWVGHALQQVSSK